MKDASYFDKMRRLEQPVAVEMANGEKQLAEYCGDVVLYAVVDGQRNMCEAKNVLYLPGLKKNVLSVNRLARSGMQVSIACDKVELVKGGKVLVVGHHTGKQYGINMLCKSRRGEAASLPIKF